MRFFKRRKDLGLRLLGVWLVAMGLTQAIQLHFLFSEILLGLLGIAAGVLILIDS